MTRNSRLGQKRSPVLGPEAPPPRMKLPDGAVSTLLEKILEGLKPLFVSPFQDLASQVLVFMVDPLVGTDQELALNLPQSIQSESVVIVEVAALGRVHGHETRF